MNNEMPVTAYIGNEDNLPINRRLQALGNRQRTIKMNEVLAKIQQEGPTHMQIWWRRNNSEGWSASQGTVAFNAHNKLVWCDDNGDVNDWPPQVNQLASIEFTEMVTTAVNAVANRAEENLNFMASSAQNATFQVANTASQALNNQAANLASEQQAFNYNQQHFFEGYQTARDKIEEERIAIAEWKKELAAKEEALKAKTEEVQKAAGEEKAALKEELERKNNKLQQPKLQYVT